MATLNSFQKLTRVLPNQPFGNGSDGAYSSATVPTLKYKSCSGSASSTTLTADTDSDPFLVGDVVGIYQTRGTGAGQWEVNRISSVGSDQYTLQTALHYTYTDSGSSQAQVVKIPMYTTVTVESGTWTPTGWDGNIGGILAIACKGTMTVTGTINSSGKGFVGGVGRAAPGNPGGFGDCGESTTGASTQQSSANGMGGGAGQAYVGTDGRKAGAGGGYATSGSNGASQSGTAGLAVGGGTGGSSDLTTIMFGGAGGGAGAGSGEDAGDGGNSGGIVIIYSNNFSISGSVNCNGNNGENVSFSGGGAGAGGSFLAVVGSATLGTNLITSAGGVGGTAATAGGNAGVGRIAIHHSSTVTGTTSPTFEDITDGSLIETSPAFAFEY